ncbi:hypothetical protein BJV74DRAFT_800116 [Russula compacta]|nr:hypothetical protein BJV74DRAFT_800116 [Russula compacta]
MPAPEPHCPLWCWQVCECVQVKAGAHGQVEASGHGRKVGVGKCMWATAGREVKLMHRTIFLAEFILGSFGHALFNPEGEGGKRAQAGRWGQAGACRRWRAEAWVGEAGEVEANAHGQVEADPTTEFILGSFGKAHIFNPGQAREALVHDPSALQHETKQPSHRGKRKGPSMV